jgi:hypothetical protein
VFCCVEITINLNFDYVLVCCGVFISIPNHSWELDMSFESADPRQLGCGSKFQLSRLYYNGLSTRLSMPFFLIDVVFSVTYIALFSAAAVIGIFDTCIVLFSAAAILANFNTCKALLSAAACHSFEQHPCSVEHHSVTSPMHSVVQLDL